MIDINKIIVSGMPGLEPEREARAAEIAALSNDGIAGRAKSEGIELTELQLEVIRCLQEIYIERGAIRHARDLAAMLTQRFSAQGGRKYLYELFPGGPVFQGGHLAGIPVPSDAQDASFGSVL